MKKLLTNFRQKISGIKITNLQAFPFKAGWSTLLMVGGYLFCAFFFYGSQLLAPLHVPIAVLLIFMAARAFFRFLRKRQIARGISYISKLTKRQLMAYRLFITGAIVVGFGAYTYVSLVPTDREVFIGKSTEEIRVLVETDLLRAAQLIDLLTVTAESLLIEIRSAQSQDYIPPQKQEDILRAWNEFLGVAIASEEVTDTHRYFSQISFWHNRPLQAQSFAISYALYMKKYAYFHEVIEAVGTDFRLRVLLNEYSESFGGPGSYNDVTGRYFATNSLLRRNVGYLYYLLFTPKIEAGLSPEYAVILVSAQDSFRYLFSNMLSHLTHRGVTVSYALHEGVEGAWLPIQKTVFVDNVGNLYISDRTAKLITKSDIATMKDSLEPGDIFVARKNWYASNVGIPGFWTHAGLYTGTLQDMEKYFAEVFPYTLNNETYLTLADLLRSRYPTVYTSYTDLDEYGFAPSVIESETRGTRIQSIEHAATVDYFGVLRTVLDKETILRALLRAFGHHGKPYDYKFSLLTKDELFCSELVYDAYAPRTEGKGVTFPRTTVSGRELIAPNDIVMKYATASSSESELRFVYYLAGVEETGQALLAGEEAFKQSYLRPKFSFLQQ